jgi:hypothetical protein
MMVDNDDPYDMKNRSMHDLIRTICGRKEDAEDHQAAKIELKRREMAEQHELNVWLMKKQHELNLKILEKQSKIAKWSIIVGFIGLILGAMIGASITVLGPTILSKAEPRPQRVSSEQSSPKTIAKIPPAFVKPEGHEKAEKAVIGGGNSSSSPQEPR